MPFTFGKRINLVIDVKTNLHKQYAEIDDRPAIDLCILAAVNSAPTRQSGLGPHNLYRKIFGLTIATHPKSLGYPFNNSP